MDMAPVASGIADSKKHWLVFLLTIRGYRIHLLQGFDPSLFCIERGIYIGKQDNRCGCDSYLYF